MEGQTRTWTKKNTIMKCDDAVMKDGRNTDIVIPVMGISGVGKSTFINILLGENRMEVGDSILSCTADVEYAVIQPACNWPKSGGRRVVIVDTPGFDDTFVDDVEILRRIGVWLASSYSEGMRVAGVIYLHNIAARQLNCVSCRNLDVLRRLCGTDSLQSVILATTSWDQVVQEVGERREKELTEKFWSGMVASGSRVLRFEKSQASARKIIDAILDDFNPTTLRIQQELVDFSRSIPQTDAGRSLCFSIQELLHMQQNTSKDCAPEQALKLEQKKAEVREQIKKLRIPFKSKLLRILGFGPR